MGAHCCKQKCPTKIDSKYHRFLWTALIVNAFMFTIEIIFSLQAKSV